MNEIILKLIKLYKILRLRNKIRDFLNFLNIRK